jgi:hypothetical protein
MNRRPDQILLDESGVNICRMLFTPAAAAAGEDSIVWNTIFDIYQRALPLIALPGLIVPSSLLLMRAIPCSDFSDLQLLREVLRKRCSIHQSHLDPQRNVLPPFKSLTKRVITEPEYCAAPNCQYKMEQDKVSLTKIDNHRLMDVQVVQHISPCSACERSREPCIGPKGKRCDRCKAHRQGCTYSRRYERKAKTIRQLQAPQSSSSSTRADDENQLVSAICLESKKSSLTLPEDSGLESFYDADNVPMFYTTATIPASSETSRSSSVGSMLVHSLQSSVSQSTFTPTSCMSTQSHHLVNNHRLLFLCSQHW